jgi:EAL domain-containing protein (putative c-di-GMP-specific phosphodiesterase class I)/GAF domain-containing protein
MTKFKDASSWEKQRLAALKATRALEFSGEPVLDTIAETTGLALKAPIALIVLIDEHQAWLKAHVGVTATQIAREGAICDYTIRGSDVLVIGDVSMDSRFKDHPMVLRKPHMRFYAGAPLRTKDGLNIGTVCVIDTKPRHNFTESDRLLLRKFAALAMARIESLRSIGFIDRVTGLLNHHRFLEDVENLLANRTSEAAPAFLGAIDVVSQNRYNEIAKAVGVQHAQQLVLKAKERLQEIDPSGVVLYHIDHARFATICPRLSLANKERLIRRISELFSNPIDCNGIPINLEPSLGIIDLGAADDAPQLFRALMAALDQARESGMLSAVYDPATDQSQQRSFALLSALHTALETADQLDLHYQPRVDTKSGKVLSVEALLRWTHPTLGPISPTEFISLAEKTALIGKITVWVLHKALKQAVEWRAAGHKFKVAINISAHDIERGGFVSFLEDLFKTYQLPLETVELEFTENKLIQDVGKVRSELLRLRKLGLDIAIDDFGTGYCNNAYLKSIPATAVKIDQSFVRGLESHNKDQIIVRSMIDLAHSLGLAVVAEGVETAESFNLLKQWGADQIQGYFIARPMDADRLSAWLEYNTQLSHGLGVSPAA